MELWYSENHTRDVKLSMRVEKQLYSAKSDYQRIDIFETPQFGRVLVLDDYVMLTEKDEFIYHEMIAHVPMAVHPNVKKVLIIGGGDGGAARELCRYTEIEQIDVVEIDEDVVNACKNYLPKTACGFDDPRVTVYFEDGMKFVRNKEDTYDLIIVDSTDPFGPGEALFSLEFYGNCYRSLRADGILINQHESPFYDADAEACKRMHKHISGTFPISRIYQAHIPTYPSGHWLFGFASKQYDPLNDLDAEKWKTRNLKCRYYSTTLHGGAFCLPAYVEELIRVK